MPVKRSGTPRAFAWLKDWRIFCHAHRSLNRLTSMIRAVRIRVRHRRRSAV